MARAVGVELTPAHVRILSLESAGKKTKILQFHEAPIPSGGDAPWEERAAATLKEACAAAKIPKSRVVAALDSGDAILREVSLPFKGEDQIRRTVRFEMESLIHNYTIEQLIVSHYKTGESDKGSLLLAAAVPKTVIEKRLKLFQSAGIDPVALDLDVAAVFNAMHHAGAIATDEPLLLVYGTPKFTKIVFIEQRQPRSIRTIRFSLGKSGAETATDPAPAAATETSAENMPLVLVTESSTDEDPSESPAEFRALSEGRQTALIAILSKEISRFLLANAAGASPAHILLSGDFGEDGAARMLESATRIPVKTFPLLESVDPEFKSPVPSARIAAPLGLALKGVGVDALSMDFRQEEFQYTKKFEALKTTALVTIELVIVFLAAIATYFYFRKGELEKNLKTVYGHHQSLYESVTGENITDASSAYVKMDELYRKAMSSAGADLPIKTSAREAWRDLFTALQRFQLRWGDKTLSDGAFFLEIESIDIQQNTTPGNESIALTMRGKIRNLEFAGHMKTEVRNVELFANADYVGQMPQVEGMVQFTLKAQKGGRQG